MRALLLALILLTGPVVAQVPASVARVDAPELARLGPSSVGIRTLHLVGHKVDERDLDVEIWYPATTTPNAAPVVYSGALTPEHATDEPVRFSNPGIAVRDAMPATGGPYPLVVLSHGHSGTPQAMAWLGENLASKGYIVVGPYHRDPPITDAAQFAIAVKWRPLDQAFAARSVQILAHDQASWLAGLVDPGHMALIGYSMGGYGAVSIAAGRAKVEGLKAVVAISPWGGQARYSAWSKPELAAITTPMLMIVGDRDDVVGYADGVRSIYEGAIHAPRYLLVFENAGHSIGMGPASAETYKTLWGLDYFEDPVWRKDRLIGVNLQMITAFLDLTLRGDASRAAYLDVAVGKGNDAAWPDGAGSPAYGAISPGTPPITVWKGFPRRGVTGLELRHDLPAAHDPVP